MSNCSEACFNDHGVPASRKYQVIHSEGAPIKAWIDGVQLEDSARNQLINTSKMPFIHKHLAVMPDVHLGFGSTVGSVIPTRGAVIPAAVGVDIGCGMMAVRTNLTAADLPDSLAILRAQIERDIPLGMNGWSSRRSGAPEMASYLWMHYLHVDFQKITDKYPEFAKANSHNHLGSLGTGNHFIELCLDEWQRVWVMLHSGSRGIGNAIGRRFIELAKEDMSRWMIHLPDKDLAYLPEGTEHFDDYVQAVGWAQRFAALNREVMMNLTLHAVEVTLKRPVTQHESAVNCHHNYIEKENHFGANVWITRKGAVRARVGELGIIPGSMGARSFIVRGKGNPDSFNSCSHGAGRKMSRTEARKTFTVEDHALATAGVECRKDIEVIDETPAAYKDIDAVMAAQSDLVEIVHTLKQVVCVKG